jgi:16S rRNA G1207 methylase RsmC
VNPEQAKYEQLWSEHPQYRIVAPGENLADLFLSVAKPQPYQTVADFGCGTGRGAARIREKTGCAVRMFDFSVACLDTKVACTLGEGFSFTQHDLTQPISERFDIGEGPF